MAASGAPLPVTQPQPQAPLPTEDCKSAPVEQDTSRAHHRAEPQDASAAALLPAASHTSAGKQHECHCQRSSSSITEPSSSSQHNKAQHNKADTRRVRSSALSKRFFLLPRPRSSSKNSKKSRPLLSAVGPAAGAAADSSGSQASSSETTTTQSSLASTSTSLQDCKSCSCPLAKEEPVNSPAHDPALVVTGTSHNRTGPDHRVSTASPSSRSASTSVPPAAQPVEPSSAELADRSYSWTSARTATTLRDSRKGSIVGGSEKGGPFGSGTNTSSSSSIGKALRSILPKSSRDIHRQRDQRDRRVLVEEAGAPSSGQPAPAADPSESVTFLPSTIQDMPSSSNIQTNAGLLCPLSPAGGLERKRSHATATATSPTPPSLLYPLRDPSASTSTSTSASASRKSSLSGQDIKGLRVNNSVTEVYETDEEAGLGTLPAELGALCIAKLGLPFLLFDEDEQLVYCNIAATSTVPALASCSASLTPSNGGNTLDHDTERPPSRRKFDASGSYSRASERSAPCRVGSEHSHSHYLPDPLSQACPQPYSPAPSPMPFDRSSSKRKPAHGIDAAEIFHFAAFDAMDLDGARLHRHATEQTFSLRHTLAESSKRSLDQPQTGAQFARQPLLRLRGQSNIETWWASSVQRLETAISAPASPFDNLPVASAARPAGTTFFAVLLTHTQAWKLPAIQACDDVSSVNSLSTAGVTQAMDAANMPQQAQSTAATAQPNGASRPAFARTTSDPPVVPDDIAGLTEKVHDSISPSFYKTAIERMPQILFTSGRDGIVTYLNPQWYEYTGWDMKAPSRELWADVFHPSDVSIAVEQYSEAIRSGSDIHLHYRVKSKDGDYRWMIARGRCIREEGSDKTTGFVCTLTDGQDLIDAQHKAVQTQQYISTVLKASAITLIVIDLSRKVTMFEGYTEALDKLGVTREEAMEHLLEDAWPDLECAEQAQAMLQFTKDTIPERDFTTHVGPSHFRYRMTPLYEVTQASGAQHDSETETPSSQRLSGIAIVCTDITAMVTAELALMQSQEEKAKLVASEEAAKEASRLKTVFVTSLSHEIRTPISSMLGISELLLGDPALDAKHRSLVQKQLHAGELLLQLVSMVLDIGKMEANKLELESQPFALTDLLSDFDIFANLAEAKNIFFERILDVRSDCALVGDRLRLAQVLSNMISNAVKFTSRGGITLRVEQEDQGDVCLMTFQLEDTGVGIDKQTLPQLFKPFHQANVTIARQFGGSGLGLSIAKSLTELMGGHLSLDSTLGIGTVVRLQIPLVKAAKPIVPLPLADVAQPFLTSTRSILREDVSILIAEDNRLLQEVYAALVRKMGFARVTVVEDGQQAIDSIQQDVPHVVLMDIEMPRMNGPEAVRILRSSSDARIKNLKIIALTANAVAGDRERFLSIGMDMYLSKPVRASALESAILQCLDIA